MMRSHYCGHIDTTLIDAEIELCGWVHRRRDHGGVIFIDLRDREGIAQIVFDPDRPGPFAVADSVRNEYVIRISGRVRHRPEGTVNPDLVLLTLDSDSGSIEMDLTVETGVGYQPAEHTEEMPIGVIPVDAIFSPVRRVNYEVEKTRVGQMTNYDKLTLEIETDATTTAQAALSQAADILVREFGRFAEIGRPSVPGSGEDVPAAPSANLLDAPIEELDLPMRAYNSLKRNSITKIGQVLSLSDDEFLRMRNFGQKSLDELKERLALRGFISPDATSMSTDESDLPASAELDEAAAAELDREA